MGIRASRISWWDCARLQLAVTFPAFFRGLVAPNRLFFGLLSRLDSEQWMVRALNALRQKYRSDHLWVWFPGGPTLLVLNRESMEFVLKSEKNQADPPIKKGPLSKFVPDGVIISSGDEWKDRRGFNKSALDFGEPHRHAEAFKQIVFREVDRLTGAEPGGALRWADFQRLGERISHQVILGSGQINPSMAEHLVHMVGRSNWRMRSPRFAAFYQELERYLSRHQAALDRPEPTQQVNGQPAPASCLMHDSAELLRAGSANSSTRVPSQIGFWFFVLKDAVELHVARTLALIAAHDEVQDRLRREILNTATTTAKVIDRPAYLDACIGEQLRLWTPVPILLRRVREAFALRDEIPLEAGQQILMHPGYYHRDPDVFGERAHRFSPGSIDADFPAVYYFSAYRQSCAGQFVARLLLKATLAALLAKFRFELVAPRIDPGRVPYSYDHFKVVLRAIRDT
jgi:cytochrome P450